jgi:hypothetical protein
VYYVGIWISLEVGCDGFGILYVTIVCCFFSEVLCYFILKYGAVSSRGPGMGTTSLSYVFMWEYVEKMLRLMFLRRDTTSFLCLNVRAAGRKCREMSRLSSLFFRSEDRILL